MNNRSTIIAVGLAFAALLAAAPAQAQRVFVSATGSDSNPCTFASPCRSFQHAHDVASSGGEIDVLDPGGYGALTINRAISIQGHGFSGITVASGAIGITISAPSTAAVALNGLLIDGSGVGQFGVVFETGSSLTVENCVVRNMTAYGLAFVSSATNAQTLAVSSSYFDDNTGFGIVIQTNSSGAVTASIDRTTINGSGVSVSGNFGTGPLTVAVTDSVAANGGAGFFVQSPTGKSVTNLSLTRVQVAGNQHGGISADGANATLWLAQSTLTGNAPAWIGTNGATINTFGDNYFVANVGDDVGTTLTPFSKQ